MLSDVARLDNACWQWIPQAFGWPYAARCIPGVAGALLWLPGAQ